MDDFKLVGTGAAVFEDGRETEGPVRFLDSPQAVIDFIGSGEASNTIVVARGGTTTFLTPALTAGVKGIVTLQGAPTSHLGILSREYGIPCVMGVTFTEGVRSSRNEIIPADGAIARLDVSTKEGRVLIEPGAPVDDAPLPDPTEEETAAAAMMEQILPLLHQFGGTIPHGRAGDEQVRAGLSSGVLALTAENTARDLTVQELNALQTYMAWNIWDFLALRATEGESGLIPRQEYECFGCVQQWLRYPAFYRLILEQVGVEGLIDLGRTARREPASKANMLHIWCTGFTPMFGRAILGELGIRDPAADAEDVALVAQFMRRLYMGMWEKEGAELFTSMRGYKGAVLDRSWIERFARDAQPVGDGERRALFTSFNASTEVLGFLLHFDNRSGLNDSGPYDLGDGRFMIVRDHFLHDPMYHWHDVAEQLPHCFTQAMIFDTGGADLDVALMDGGTTFTEPANYLQYLQSAAVYVRERWETPAAEIRLIDDAEMQRYLDICGPATTALYKRIASMPPRDKIMAGAQVYYSEFVVPFARLAGVWEQMRDELDFHELDPVASEAYYPLVRDGLGKQLVAKLFITGTGFPALPEGALIDVPLAALHPLVLRGTRESLEQASLLEEAGLVVKTSAGYIPTEAGLAKHASLLAAEQGTLDRDTLEAIYERFLAANGPFKALGARWQSAAEDDRWELVGELADLVERVEPALRRTSELLPRFDGYAPRLSAALEKVEAGEHDYVTSPRLESLHTVWMELHEDYLQTLGISREEEGSY
ncbi:MAG TPA: PEP-utilizing enzyme [Solirubrobacteraceae bacterium]|jgi:phosphohistidine swiveling domain-containing protein|nr:PEP-utilizing enzyme [Solirubrobacteraceae bacterium]